MKNEVSHSILGDGAQVATSLLKKAGYSIDENGRASRSSINIYLSGTLFGAIPISGDTNKDGEVLHALEAPARTKLEDYNQDIANLRSKKPSIFYKPQPIQKIVKRHFTSVEIQKILLFPFIFLGYSPLQTKVNTSLSSTKKLNLLVIRCKLKKSYKGTATHNFVISRDLTAYSRRLFGTRKWPGDPSYYVRISAKELVIEVPISSNDKHSVEEREKYADWIIDQAEKTLHLDGLSAQFKAQA